MTSRTPLLLRFANFSIGHPLGSQQSFPWTTIGRTRARSNRATTGRLAPQPPTADAALVNGAVFVSGGVAAAGLHASVGMIRGHIHCRRWSHFCPNPHISGWSMWGTRFPSFRSNPSL